MGFVVSPNEECKCEWEVIEMFVSKHEAGNRRFGQG